jgi:hypothetical protein
MTLALTGSSYGETEPKKATDLGAGRRTKTPDFTGENNPIPAEILQRYRQESREFSG